MFRVDLVAFRTNLFVHRSIGATIRAYHWEVWWRKERWVETPVATLTVRVLYEGLLAGGEPGTGTFVHEGLEPLGMPRSAARYCLFQKSRSGSL
jgi:hypothetical protein